MSSKGKLQPPVYYQRELRSSLPEEVFKRYPSRVIWLFVHLSIIGVCGYFITSDSVFFLIKLILAMIIGNSLGTMGFLGHEILHGTVVRGHKLMLFLGGICMLHWGLPPHVWINWHNRTHHVHTNKWFKDPDCFGPVEMYKKSKWIRFMEKLTPGSGTKRSYLFLFYWFTLHTAYNIYYLPKAFRYERNRKFGKAYFAVVHLLWGTLAFILSSNLIEFLSLFFIPIMVSNFIMMSYVATNHFINPSTNHVSDPLINSLTVRSRRWIEYLHLNNNFHVEHHLFPDINPSQATYVAEELKKRWPQKYQEMGHGEALKNVYKTPRLYSSDTELKNPRTGEKASTLLAHYLDH